MASSTKNDFDEPSRELFINNLPDGISETGIRKLFVHYGNTVNIRKLNQECAIIKFSDKKEAESAFINLNGTKPLCLKINYLKEEYGQQNLPTNLTTPEDNKSVNLIVGKYYELRKKIANNKCSHCENVAYYSCRDCQEFYCSQICQKNDWPKHHKLCTGSKVKTPNFRDNQPQIMSPNQSQIMSPNQSQITSSNQSHITSPIQSQSQQQTHPYNNKRYYKNGNSKVNENRHNQNPQPSLKHQESDSEIVITHFTDPNIVYFRSNTPEFNQIYKAMIKRVHENASKAKNPIFPINVNDIHGCNFEGNWYRAKVIDIKNDKIRINYIDFGNEQIVDSHSLRRLDSEILQLLPDSITCKKLHNVRELTNKARTLLTEWVYNEQPLKKKEIDGNFIEIFTSDGKNIKHLFEEKSSPSTPKNNSSFNKSFSKKVQILQKTSTPIASKESLINGEENVRKDRIMYPDDLKYSSRNPGDTFKLILFFQYDNIYQFGAEVSNALTNVYNLTTDFTTYCETCEEKEYRPIEYEVILVKLIDDDAWYRAYCLQYYPDKELFHVNFLDFGNVIKVKPSDIRKIPRKFIEPEVIGMTFAVEGCPEELSESHQSRFKEMFTINNTYDVTLINEDSNGVYTFRFNDLVEKLKPIFEQK